MKDARIREALEANLSGVSVSQRRHREMIDTITGGKTMKRKWSVGLVLALALLALSVTAVAATLINRTFEQVIDMEVENGPIFTWSYDEKLRLVTLLSEDGWAFPAETLALLNDEQASVSVKDAAITQLITEALGREDAVSHIDIIERVKGPMTTWSLEDRAWYSDFIRARIDVLDAWHDILPEEGDLTPEQAVQIAKDALLAALEVTENELDGMLASVSFFTNGEGMQPRWMIDFLDDPYGGPEYTVLLTREGEVTEDVLLDVYTPEHEAERRSQTTAPDEQQAFWSLEDKAAYIGEENGLPAPDEIREEQAIAIARDAVIALGIDPTALTVSVWYKLYDPYDSAMQGPFYAIYWIDDPDAPYESYCVIIDPQSGEVLKTTSSMEDSTG